MRQLIILILLSSVLSACKIGEKVHSFFSPISENELSIINDSKFIDAISYKNSGDHEKAIELLNQIVRTKGNNAPAYFELAKINSQRSRNQEALQNINNALNLNPKNKWYLNFKIKLTSQLGLFEQCQEAYLLRKKIYPLNTNYDIELSDFYVFRKKYLKALKIYNSLENKIGISHDVNYSKFLIYRGMGDDKKCEQEIKKLISTFPGKRDYYIHFADFKFALGENESALKIYNQSLKVNPNDPYILIEQARFYYADNQKEKAKQLFKDVVRNPAFELEDKRKILLKFQLLTEQDKNLFDFTQSIMILASKSHPYDPVINLIVADFIFAHRHYKESINYYKRVVESKPSEYDAWIQLIISYYNISAFDEMLEESTKSLDFFPTQPYLYLYNGISHIQLKHYSSAIDILQEGYDLALSTDKKLKAKFASSLGDAYHASGKYGESDDYFELSLELDSENYFVLNNYAYYLSERGVKLNKAKQMSKKSNDLYQDEASFQDTFGWILYQLGQYEKALQWLKKSELNGGNSSSIINEHIGDVYEKLGNVNEAKKYWNQAKENGGNTNELLNKLKR